MRVFLTGGQGFIGSYVLKYLLEAGTKVNLLLREPRISGTNDQVRIIKGNITESEVVKRGLEGCEVVIHLAALVQSDSADRHEFNEANLNGTQNMLQAAAELNIKKFVFTSSLSAYCFAAGDPVNETHLIKPCGYFSAYAESKAKAEELVIEQCRDRMAHIILYPARVFGIGPLRDSNAAVKALRLYLKNRLPFIIDNGDQYSSWAFVEDVAAGIVSAALGDRVNERYILGGENKTLTQVYDMADYITGKRHLRIRVKMETALKLASVLKFQSELRGKKPLVTPEWLTFVMESRMISSSKAISGINYKVTPFREAIEKTVNWLVAL